MVGDSDTGGSGSGSVAKAMMNAPLTLWLAIATQFAGLAFWIGSVSSEISDNTKEIAALRSVNIDARISRIEATAQLMDEQLDRIEAKVDRLSQR
jgi:hypothetical protein